MKLRSKFILFFTFLMVILIAGSVFCLNFYFKNYFKIDTLNNFQILAELSESSYFGFINGLKIRTIDWSLDGYIRRAIEEILKTPIEVREPLIKTLNSYLKNEKIIHGHDILMIDILDKNGVVLSSSVDERIGIDEKKEELEGGEIKFIKAIQANFGESFAVPVIAGEHETDDPMIHLTTRIFSSQKDQAGNLIPLNAVMLIHFVNTAKLRDVLIGNIQQEEDRMTSKELTKHYKTADIYLVNKDRLMITPSRLSQETILKQKIDTEPVKACFEKGEEIKSEYLNYRGELVFGASMCIEKELTLVLEAESREILAPIKNVSQFLIILGGMALFLILVGIILLSHWLLRGLKMITDVAKKVSSNNFKVRAKINSKDEIGYLAKVFNQMLDNLENYYKNMDRKEEELKKEISFISLLQKVSSKANEVSSFEELMKFSLGEVCHFAKWPIGHYYTFDKKSERFIPSEVWYFDEPVRHESFKKTIMEATLKRGEGVIGKIYQDKMPVWEENIVGLKDFGDITEEMAVKGFFALPVIVKSEIFAVLDFYHSEAKGLDNELIKALSSIAVQFERAIKKKQTEDSLKDSVEKTEKIKIALYNILGDMKESESMIKKKHHQMTAVTSSIGEGLFVLDENFKIILINPTAQKLLEISEQDAIGKKITEVIKVFKDGKELEEKERLLINVVKEGKSYAASPQDNIFYKTFSGRMFPVTEVGTPLKDGIVGAVIVFRDISNEKAIDEARVNFVSTASHQLRTPLTSIKWFLEMLVNGDAGALNKEQESYTQNIYQSIERMTAMVDLLLQIARVEAGRIKIEPISVDLKTVAEEAVAVFKSVLAAKFQKVEITTEPKKLPAVLMDKDVINQVAQNLLSNAIRYTPINKTIKISIAIKNNNVEFSIKDPGIGIPQEQSGRIFEKFFRASNALKMVPEGSGLGLSLVKMLVNDWGGKIWFSANGGEKDGTTFFFTIPLAGMKPKDGEVKLAT